MIGLAPAAFWSLSLVEWRCALEALPLRFGGRPAWEERERRAGFATFKRELADAGQA